MVRLELSVAKEDELRHAVARGSLFVATVEVLEAGQPVELAITLGSPPGSPATLLHGVAGASDFDEHGAVGVWVQLGPTQAVSDTRIVKRSATPTQAPEAGPEPVLEPGTTIDERFRIEAHLATGGMGQVYRATHVHLNRVVALKLLRGAFATDADMWARFRREAELVSQLESPHVVRVFDFGKTEAGQPFLAMEFVEGPTLAELIEREGAMAPERAISLLRQVCDGLSEAHALGVVHRDLKPANIIIGRRRDGTEVAKLLDFGIARLADEAQREDRSRITKLGTIVGTPAYLAPEQALADTVDERTDLYALGCVAFELLTGLTPFMSGNLQAIVSQHLTEPAPTLASRRPELANWPHLETLIARALVKQRVARIGSAKEFAAALVGPKPLLLDQPVLPPAPATPEPVPLEQQVPPSQRLPQISAVPTSGDPWSDPSTPHASGPEVVVPAPVDDFFGSAGGGQKQARASSDSGVRREGGVLGALTEHLPVALQTSIEGRRAATPLDFEAVVVRVEILGPPQGSFAATACLARGVERAYEFGGYVDALDEDGATLLFHATHHLPVARALLAALAVVDTVALEGQGAAAARCAVLKARCQGDHTPMIGEALAETRRLIARRGKGQVVTDRVLYDRVSESFEASVVPDGVIVSTFKPRRPAAVPLRFREELIVSVDKKVATPGPGAAFYVSGQRGSGRTAVAAELATRGRKRGAVVATVNGSSLLAGHPFAAFIELVCTVCGVELEPRGERLRAVLEGLRLPPPVLEAVLVVAGVTQLPAAFSAGQVVHAVRVVIRAMAEARPVLVIFDGIDDLDPASLEALRVMATTPVQRETVVVLGSADLAARVGAASSFELRPLAPNELTVMLTPMLSAPPSEPMVADLMRRSAGQAGLSCEWLSYLDGLGALRVVDGLTEVVDEWPDVTNEALPAARWATATADVRLLVDAGVVVGDVWDETAVRALWPQASSIILERAIGAGLIRSVGGSRYALSSQRLALAVSGARSVTRTTLHLRWGVWLMERLKNEPGLTSWAAVARRFSLAHDGARAAPVWKHAAELAFGRRAFRDLSLALGAMAEALAWLPDANAYFSTRIECLTRAAALSLAMQDPVLARTYLDEATLVSEAAELPSAELLVVTARLLRSEARRAKSLQALDAAAQLAGETPVRALVAAERAESFELEGDFEKARAAYDQAIAWAKPARELASWHGEVDLEAKLEARAATMRLELKDSAAAQRLFASSLERYRTARWPYAMARVLMNLGTINSLSKDFAAAAQRFDQAAQTAAACGDLLFQARALVQLAKAQRRSGLEAQAKASEATAKTLAQGVGWHLDAPAR